MKKVAHHVAEPRRTRRRVGLESITLRNPALVMPAVWVVLATGLASVTGRVGDWFVMTDELVYERLAINSSRYLTPLPSLRGHLIPSFGQLYPLLIAPIFRSGSVPHDLHEAHVFDAWIMASACVPAFLLARRVAGHDWVAYLVAVLAVVIPSIVYADYLLTEVAAYPAFLWAVLGMERSLAAPSHRHDVLALAGLLLAFLARTEFAILALALPLALLLYEIGRTPAAGPFARIGVGLRLAAQRHRLLVAVYAAGALAAGGLEAAGHLGAVLGIYSGMLSGGLPPHLLRSVLEHLATVALGVGILPVLVGLAWSLSNLVRPSASRDEHAFACLTVIVAALLLFEVTIFDLRLGVGLIVYDRYLFYLFPLFVLATLCALGDRRRLTWSLLFATVVIAAGFALNDPPRFEWQQFSTLSPDAPIAVFYRPLDALVDGVGRARAALALGSILLAALFALAARRAPRRLVSGGVVALLLVAMPLQTGYVLHRLFAAKDWALRPITYDASGVQTWLDAAVGPSAEVTEVPFPVDSDFFVNEIAWRDLEFWNKSVVRAGYYESLNDFRYTGNLFPQILLSVDPQTGAFNESPSPWAAQSSKDTRFQIAGFARASGNGIVVVHAGDAWRALWLSSGFYDDGWTEPGVDQRLHVFAQPGQRHGETRTFAIALRPPTGVARRPLGITTNLERWHGVASDQGDLFADIPVCVPTHGFAVVTIHVRGASAIPGDLSTLAASEAQRRGGVFFGELALEGEVGKPCDP